MIKPAATLVPGHLSQERSTVFSKGSVDRVAVTMAGRTFEPDAGTAYLHCTLSHVVPVFTWYGEGLSPSTVGAAWRTMLHKPLNRDHRMKSYDPKNIPADWVIGCAVAVESALASPGSQRVPATVEESPGIDVVCAIFKAAAGVPDILGKHQSGRQEFTVSMEISYNAGESGFLVDLRDDDEPDRALFAKDQGGTPTPPTWSRAGWMYVPVQEADEDLLAARNLEVKEGRLLMKKRQMRDRRPDGGGWYGRWRDHDVWWLMGGMNGTIDYQGIGVVGSGAEPTAKITQMVAHRAEDEQNAADFLTALGRALSGLSTH
ncbi:MAG: hypothetical protein ACYDC1_11990 [Limisphaerales bacterium]